MLDECRTASTVATGSRERSSQNAFDITFRFGVSFRDGEEMMAARRVLVSFETVRCWCDKFGKQYADGLRRRRARTGDKWHLDEVFSRSTASLTTSSEPLIRTGLSSISS